MGPIALIHRSVWADDLYLVSAVLRALGMVGCRPRCLSVFHYRSWVTPFGWVYGGSGRFRRQIEVVEQCLPWCLPGPRFGQMKTDLPGAGGDAGRDVDEFAADRSGTCLAEPARGEDQESSTRARSNNPRFPWESFTPRLEAGLTLARRHPIPFPPRTFAPAPRSVSRMITAPPHRRAVKDSVAPTPEGSPFCQAIACQPSRRSHADGPVLLAQQQECGEIDAAANNAVDGERGQAPGFEEPEEEFR
jgi:hypothetical protein